MIFQDAAAEALYGSTLSAILQDMSEHSTHADQAAHDCLAAALGALTSKGEITINGDEFSATSGQIVVSDLMAALGFAVIAEHLSAEDCEMLHCIGPLTDWCELEIRRALGDSGAIRVLN